ncbi:circadian clock protein KaiC [Lysobacter sp. TY2-98]|uniref:ATPase domain-containing protein n=1 Tax=Lysobacter sp. TY2-98 TaxID=2290922 RepID=UPI000E207994|nr:ATPase domain-containing protein [Lysobacter sp. TY2-98]AXK72157.1 circadian clock protein KaiC [Lysobacter sp. TY2-98]
MNRSSVVPRAIGSGVPGLDAVLSGGFTPNRLYLVEGAPGAGKTTLAIQFLLEGLRQGERVLYVTLSETVDELHEMAASHGWSLDGIDIFEMLEGNEHLDGDAPYTMFHPSEIELAETTQRILKRVAETRPQRLVFDSLAELRLLSGSALRYRRHVLSLKQALAGSQCTTLLLDHSGTADHGLQVHTIVHGVVNLSAAAAEFGGDRHRVRVSKYRGRRAVGGYHDYRIETGGLRVFPRLVAAHFRRLGKKESVGTGSAQFDLLLGGGIDRGTSTLLVGAAGTGKSSLSTLVAITAAQRGEHAAIFAFDESEQSLLTRAAGMGMALESYIESGLVQLRAVDPAELTPGEFTQLIRRAVEEQGARVIVFDSLNGYFNAMPDEQHMMLQMHELLAYLGAKDVITLMVSAQLGLIGSMTSTVDVSYLADSVVLLRYFEAIGEVRQAISVLKKRTGSHERTIRPMKITASGFTIGEPLSEFRGVLTGVPQERAPAGGPAP